MFTTKEEFSSMSQWVLTMSIEARELTNMEELTGLLSLNRNFLSPEHRYKCNYKTCWKSLKGECGYKEFALHVISDHGGLEMVLEEDERPELQTVLGQIRQVKAEKRAADQPLCCVVVGCEDAEREHIKDDDYRTLRNHYAVAHWRRWFERPPGPGQPPRTQKLTKTGAFCQVSYTKLLFRDRINYLFPIASEICY